MNSAGFRRRKFLLDLVKRWPPSEEAKLNEFADAYNEYVEGLRKNGNSVADTKGWARVEKAWERLR